jgi:putative flippase GtrA
MSFAQYVRFLVVGGFVALITIGVREVMASVLAADTAIYFSVSVVSAYVVGIALSYLLNHWFTFRGVDSFQWHRLLLFVGIAFVGLLLTWLLSLAIRYGTPVGENFGKYSASMAFAVAALLSSLVTYPLNALLVFNKRFSSAESRADCS